MIPISSAVSRGLVWSKTSHKRGYELKCNGEIAASLQHTSCWSSEYLAESKHGSWRFRRTGAWRTGTEIVDANSGVRIASLKPNWVGGGTLVFSDGQIFGVTSKGWWQPVWTVLAETGQPVLSIQAREKTVELRNELPLSEDRLILLTVFAWHIMRQAAEDAAAAAVMAAVTS